MSKKVLIIISSITICTTIILVFVYRWTFNGELSNDSTEWSNFVTYFSGFLTPIISLIGFYLVILTITNANNSTRINSFQNAIKDVENQIEEILKMEIKIKIDKKNEKKSFRETLSMRPPVEFIDIGLRFVIQKTFNFRQYLIILAKLIERINELDKKNNEWTVIYKFKYSVLYSNLTNTKNKLYNLLLCQEEEQPELKLSEKDRQVLNYYSINSQVIHDEES